MGKVAVEYENKKKKTTTQVDNYTNPMNDGMNLSGVNNIQNAVGKVRDTRGNTSTVTSSYSNALGNPAKNKTSNYDFTGSSKVNVPSTSQVKSDLKKAQSTLSSMADDSNRKAQAFLKGVASTFAYDANKVSQYVSPTVKNAMEREKSLNTEDFIAPEVKLAQKKAEEDNARSTKILLNGGESKGYALSDEDLDKLPSVLIDQRTGQEANQQYVGNLYDNVNNNYNYVNSLIESLNDNYNRGLVSDDEYKKLYSQYQKMWDSNKKDADELSNYQYLSGRNYYDWLRENGSEEEIKDFEALVGSYDDSVFESLLNQWKATQVNTINRPFQAYSMIRSFLDENYDYNDPNNISSQLNETAEELQSYAYNGKNGEGFRYYSLQTIGSLMPMINDAVTGSVLMGAMGLEGKTLEKAVGAFTNIEMGIGSAEQTYRQRLSEGNSTEVAFSNAVAHGVITALVEAFNMGNIGNVVSLLNGPAKHVLGMGLLSLPNFIQMGKNMAEDAFGEGLEEVYETLLTAIVDGATNVILSNFSDERVGIEPIKVGGIGDGGLTDQFIMAGAGAVILGGGTNAKITVDSLAKYNAGGQAIQYWQKASEFHRSIGEVENAQICDAVVDLIAQERQTYYDKSIVKDAVQTAEDMVAPAPSVDDVMNMVANGFRADVSNQFEVNDKQRQEGLNILNKLETEFNNRGYSNRMNFDSYVQSTPEVRDASKKLMNFADAIGAKMRITDEFMYAKDGRLNDVQMRNNENGVTVLGDTIVINPFATDFLQDGGGQAMLKTFAHELTHTTENTGAYKDLKNAVMGALGGEWNNQFNQLKDLYQRNGKNLSDDGVEREVVAKYIEENIGNEQFLQTISDYNESLFTRIYSGMRAMLSSDPNAKVAQDFFRAYNERIDMAMNSIAPTNVFGDLISANDCQFNIAQYNERGKYVLRDYLNELVENKALAQEEADDIAETLDFYHERISELMADPELGFDNFSNWSNVSMTIDHDGFPQLTCVVKNDDYEMNIDFSTVCKKRKVADAVFNELAREGILDKQALTGEDIATLRDIIKRNGLEVACSLCFVDSKRFRQGSWADTLVNGKEDKVNKKLVELGVQSKDGHVMGWNEMVDVLANDPSEIGDFNFANRTETNEGTLHTLSDSEVNQKGLKFLQKVANGTATEAGKIARVLLDNPELRKHMLLGDLYASESFGNIKRGNQDLFKIVNNHQGSAKPKSPFIEVTYNNEIITSPIFDSEKAKTIGGVRIQSFSDYMANMVFDYMEMVAELQGKHLTAQSYTKVKDFAELFGNTGIKINLSIIPKATTMTAREFASLSDEQKAEVKQYAGLERFSIEDIKNMDASERERLVNERGLSLSEDGSCYTAYIFEDESFDWLEALELQSREGYDKNVGTICVGVSDEHILKMMNDDNVKMIIPYHKSSLNPMVAHMMNIGAYNDYTNSQNTRVLQNGKWGSIGSTKLDDFLFYADENGMMNNGYDAKATSRAYLNWCAEKGYLPKFDQFAYIENVNGDWVKNENGSYSYVGEGNGNLSVNDNYYKVLVDFRAYDRDGNLAPQESVRQEYPADFMDKLKQSLTNYEEITNKQKSLLPQIVNQAKEELFNNDLQNSLSETTISDVDSDGNKLSEQQREYFRNSKIVDDNGNLMKVYHGTRGDFTIFDIGEGGRSNSKAGIGFWFTPSKEGASNFASDIWYGENDPRVMETYLNITNPYVYETVDNSAEMASFKDELMSVQERIKELKERATPFMWADDGATRYYAKVLSPEEFYNHGILKEDDARLYLEQLKEYEELQSRKKQLENDMDNVRYNDAYERFRTDIYAVEGQSARDANTGGVGMSLGNQKETLKKYRDNLINQGYDGIIIRGTRYDSDLFGGENDQYIAFFPEQIKNANNTNPTSNPDIQYSLGGVKGLDNLWLNGTEEDIKNYDKAVQLREEANNMRAELNEDGTRKYTEEDIKKKTGWFIPDYESDKTKDRFEFYDDKIIDDLAKYVDGQKGLFSNYRGLANVVKQPKLKDIIGSDNLLFKMYPELGDVYFVVANRKSATAGMHTRFDRDGKTTAITINKKDMNGKTYNNNDIVNALAHEIQHFIQYYEGFKVRDYREQAYMERPGEKEAFEVGRKQENPASRQFDMFSDNMNLDGEQVFNDIETSGEDIGFEGESPEVIPDGDGTLNTDIENGENGQDTSGNSRGDFESPIDSGNEAEGNILNVSDIDIPITSKSPSTGTFSSNGIAQVLSEKPRAESVKERWERIKRFAKHEIIDHLDAVRELARQYKNNRINTKADLAMLAPNMAYETIMNRRTKLGTNEVIGKSLREIYGKIPQDQKQLFDEYMYQWLNTDRMSVESRLGGDYENKPVFGKNVTAEDSAERIAEIEREHPEYRQIAEDVWEYTRQNLQMLVDGGIISKQQYDNFQNATPHYVPVARNVDGGTGVSSTDPNKAIKRFKGSSIDILPLEGTLIKQTQNIYRSVLSNSLHNEILDTLGNASNIGAENIETVLDDGFNPLEADPKGGRRLHAYRNGQKYSIPIGEDLYNSLSPRKNPFNLPDSQIVQGVNEFRRNLITGWNPLFMITNAVKDIQDAGFNTKYPKQFVPNFLEAWAQILSNGEYKQLYLANGGRGNTYINELGDAKMKGRNPFVKAFNAVVSANEAVEMAPRLAEFISTLRDGKSIDEAMYNASEITTNFKRGGDTAKYFNRNGMAFLNASIQGFDKQVRNFKDAKDGGARGMLTYMAKVALSGVPLYILNKLMWKDDEDYEELSDYVKDNYYIIKKYGDGKFIRIPKGRVASFIQTVLQNGVDTAKGDAKIWDALVDNYMSFMDNIAPNNPIENFIATPLIDAMNNKAWYGGELLPTRLQDVPDSEQYDESTDALSIAIGDLSKKVADATGMDFLEISPYKLNYVLDQYSGAIGDVLLPMITPETTSDVNNPILKGLTAPVLDKFTTDSVLKNENVTAFYTLRDELNRLSNSVNATDEQTLASKYLYSVSSEMGKLYAKKHEIQADKTLTNKEKYDQVREIQSQINELAKAGLANYDQIDLTDKYASVGGVQYYKKDDGSWVKPSKSALENVSGLSAKDSSVYFETFGEITNTRSQIKKDTPEGQTANYTRATVDAISNANMSYEGKNALYDSYYDSKTTNHINAMDLSDEQKYELKVAGKLAEGTKDSNGKTVANSKAQATAEAYAKLGLLDDVVEYIQKNNIDPSEMGLSKTVYKNILGGANYQDVYNSSFSSKKSSSGSKKSSRSVSGGASSSRLKARTSKIASSFTSMPKKSNIGTGVADAYLRAYSSNVGSTQGTGSQKVSTASASVICPKCRNRVTPVNGKCPICGNGLQ